MKTCLNCDQENQDDATSCQSCGTTTFVSTSPAAIGGHIITPAEKRFWERMTFRQFGVLLIRMQALWFVVAGVKDAVYLPRYFERLHEAAGSMGYSDARQSVFLALVTILINIAGAVVCIQFADKIVSWLMKDFIPKTPPEQGQEPKPTGPAES
jgi:hypothetical protein